MSKASALTTVLRDLVIANRILANENVLDGFGHVSVRHPDNPERYFLSRSRGPALVTLDDLIEFTLDNEPIDRNGRPMYAERPIHGCIYQARPDVRAVCHNHALSLLPFGISALPLQPVFHMASVIGKAVPVWDIRDEFGDTNLLVTTAAQGRSLARGLGDGRVALMRGHGGVVAGRSLHEAVFVAIYLQINADLLLRAQALGGLKLLSPGEVERASGFLLEGLSQERAWDYWCARAGFRGI